MKAALFSPEQNAVHVEPLAAFVEAERAAVLRGEPARWRLVGAGTDEEARAVTALFQDRRERIERAGAAMAAIIRQRRAAKKGARPA